MAMVSGMLHIQPRYHGNKMAHVLSTLHKDPLFKYSLYIIVHKDSWRIILMITCDLF